MAATGPGYPGGANTYVPSFADSGNLVIGFSRNVKKFPLPRYVQYVKTQRQKFYYATITPDQAARVVNMRDFAFPDGQNRPRPDGLETFNFVPVACARWQYGFVMGELSAEQAAFDIRDAHVQIAGAKGMTARTNRVSNILTTASNWPSTHTSNGASLVGGLADAGSGTTPYYHEGLNKMAVQIGLDTRSTVQNEDLMVILDPISAKNIATSQEVQQYLANSYWARKVIEEGLGSNARYGLPDTVYGYKHIVEDTVLVTTLPNTDSVNYAATGTYAYGPGNIVLLSRPGGVEGVFGSVSFSTFTEFIYEDFTQEQFDDRENRLLKDFVTENTAEVLTAPVSGFLWTGATALT
jgi:hypothetical protein